MNTQDYHRKTLAIDKLRSQIENAAESLLRRYISSVELAFGKDGAKQYWGRKLSWPAPQRCSYRHSDSDYTSLSFSACDRDGDTDGFSCPSEMLDMGELELLEFVKKEFQEELKKIEQNKARSEEIRLQNERTQYEILKKKFESQ